jgi:hypothetical protein
MANTVCTSFIQSLFKITEPAVVISFYDGNVFPNAGIDPSLLNMAFSEVGERVATAQKALGLVVELAAR